MNKKTIGCNECGNNIKIETDKEGIIRIVDLTIEKLSGGDEMTVYRRGYIDALVKMRKLILQRVK